MKYVYHMKPFEMVGEHLLPVSDLGSLGTGLHEYHRNRMTNREFSADTFVPKLNCLWNDVIHFSTVHPSIIYQNLKASGLEPNPECLWYKIPVESLSGLPLALYRFENSSENIEEEEVEIISSSNYEENNDLPTKTKNWYSELGKKGEIRHLFHHIPQLLVKGKVNVESAEIIRWC